MNKELTIRYDEKDLTKDEAIALLESIERQKKFYDAADKKVRELLLQAMEDTGTIKLENESILVNYIAATDKETFDSKAFRKDHADMYDEYIRFTTAKPSVRITLR